MIIFKTVKPSKMKVDAFRLEFLTCVHKAARGIKKDFQSTTDTWEHKPVFEEMISLKGGPSVLVATDDQIYNWVDNGTDGPYPIPPKDPNGVLVFNVNFTAKTIPGVIGSRPGGKYGPKRKHKAVMHPGIEARHFDKDIQKMWQPKFKRMAEEAMRIAVEKSGHKI